MGWVYARGTTHFLVAYFVLSLVVIGFSFVRSTVWVNKLDGQWHYLGDAGCIKDSIPAGKPVTDPPGVGQPCSIFKQGDRMLFHYPLEGVWRIDRQDGEVVRVDNPLVH